MPAAYLPHSVRDKFRTQKLSGAVALPIVSMPYACNQAMPEVSYVLEAYT